MINEIKDTYNINELKKQLVRFFFSSHCFGFVGSIELLKNGENIRYRHSYDEIEDKYTEYEYTMDNWENFVNELFNMNIHKWKEIYKNKVFAEDCEEWTIEMEFSSIEKITRFGYDEYPYNWKIFENIISKYFPQMEY